MEEKIVKEMATFRTMSVRTETYVKLRAAKFALRADSFTEMLEELLKRAKV